jgi:hypothetical protein
MRILRCSNSSIAPAPRPCIQVHKAEDETRLTLVQRVFGVRRGLVRREYGFPLTI